MSCIGSPQLHKETSTLIELLPITKDSSLISSLDHDKRMSVDSVCYQPLKGIHLYLKGFFVNNVNM